MGADRRAPSLNRWAGALWILGPAVFVAATTAEALWLNASGYSYSFLNNTISNLGDPSLYPAPYYWMLNVSLIALGLLVLGGIPAFRSVRPRGSWGAASLVLLPLTALGAIGVGVFNEHLNYPVHISMAALAFISGGLVLLTVGVAGFFDQRWRAWALPSIVGAVVTAAALVAFTTETTWGLGHGGWERLIVAAPMIWIILVGVRLLREPAPRASVPVAPAPGSPAG